MPVENTYWLSSCKSARPARRRNARRAPLKSTTPSDDQPHSCCRDGAEQATGAGTSLLLMGDLAFGQCSLEFLHPGLGDTRAEAEQLLEPGHFPQMVRGCVSDPGSREPDQG